MTETIRLTLRDREQHYAQAIFSDDRRYRYWWHRVWANEGPLTAICMLNPSYGNAEKADPTLRRVLAFAHAWGSRGVIVVNLYAAISSDPDELLEMDDPVGGDNDRYLGIAMQQVREVVCAWGQHRMAWRRSSRVLSLIKSNGCEAKCFRITKMGAPEHPLYMPSNLTPVPYFIGGKRG